MQEEKECYLCRKFYDMPNYQGLECHHIFGGANRTRSDQDGMTVWLCQRHHNTEPDGVHFNKKYMDILRQDGQKTWEKIHGGRYDFMRRYGKNYL